MSRFDSLQEDMKGISEAVKNVKSKYGITSLGFESCNGVERFWDFLRREERPRRRQTGKTWQGSGREF